MKAIVGKLKIKEEEIAKREGPFSLFGLFLREDYQDKWDLLISGFWVDKDSQRAIDLLGKEIQSVLTSEELSKITRIVVINSDDSKLQAIHKAVDVEHGIIEVDRWDFFDFDIKSAYLITSKGVIQTIKSAFKPFECRVKYWDYGYRLSFKVLDSKKEKIIEYPEVTASIFKDSDGLNNLLEEARQEIIKKGYKIDIPDSIEYKGYVIKASTYEVLEPNGWVLSVDIEERSYSGIRSRNYFSKDIYKTKEEAKKKCLIFGKQIIDGKYPHLKI